jgi:REP element-mobilizing transposase RayT
MAKFQNKYRNESARAPWWNYANDGAYFITICTAERKWLFGEISNNEMNLSPIGEMVYQEWNVSFDMRAELFCDTFVIMPNHIHAILRIDNNIVGTHGIVRTHGRASLQTPPKNTGVAYRSPKSISSFMAGFKSAATKRINEYRISPKMSVWQTRFHDHIIRNDAEYQRIYNYIETNIQNWEKDTFFKNETA